jgi:hypothetical protein
METTVVVREVQAVQSRSGNTRYVLTDEAGKEYVTFREEIGARAAEFRGRRARIEYHEQQRGNYRNVYLDSIAPAADDSAAEDQEVDEVAWKTAVDAAPWLLGGEKPEGEVPPEELFDKLKPFKDLVADDIEQPGGPPEDE